MTARSTCYGHPVYFDADRKAWLYESDGTPASTSRACHGCGRASAILNLGGQPVDVDACIAPVVQALNDAGIVTIASCCGHTHRPGSVVLSDRRELIVCPDFETGRQVAAYFPSINGDPPQALAASSALAEASAALDDLVAPDPEKSLAQRIRDEFHDFKMVIDHCEKVYIEISGGHISKCQTLPEEVLTVAGDLATQRTNEAVREETAELREALWDIAGTIVAVCDSGKTHVAELACMENSPLVGKAREVVAAFQLGPADVLPAATDT